MEHISIQSFSRNTFRDKITLLEFRHLLQMAVTLVIYGLILSNQSIRVNPNYALLKIFIGCLFLFFTFYLYVFIFSWQRNLFSVMHGKSRGICTMVLGTKFLSIYFFVTVFTDCTFFSQQKKKHTQIWFQNIITYSFPGGPTRNKCQIKWNNFHVKHKNNYYYQNGQF